MNAALGTVYTDINGATSANAQVRGANRLGVATPGKGLLFNVTAGSGTGELLLETDYGYGGGWLTLRPALVSLKGGIDVYLWAGPGMQTHQTLVNYRALWVAKQAAASVVVQSQVVDLVQLA